MKCPMLLLAAAPLCLALTPSNPAISAIFEPNRGQAPAAAAYVARLPQMEAALSAEGAAIFLTSGQPGVAPSRISLRFAGANAAAAAEPLDRVGSVSSYFVGPEKDWIRGLPNYSGVTFKGVYPGIDLVYYANASSVEYDLRVRPGADLSKIAIAVEGAAGLRLDPNGDLRISTDAGELIHKRPKVLQEGREIACGYSLKNGVLRFRLAAYDRSKPLVIDPVMFRLGTFYKKAAVDASGNLYITASPNTTSVTVRKLSNVGALLYTATLAVQSLGDIHVATGFGGTAFISGATSGGLAVKNAAQGTLGGGIDGFVAKVNPAGTDVDYSTYVGGSAADTPAGIAVDAAGSAYITGSTVSTNFPVANSLQNQLQGGGSAFITKLTVAGSQLAYSTYFGGAAGATFATGIGLNAAGDVFVAGYSGSPSLPVANAFQIAKNNGNDGFLLKLNVHTSGTPTVAYSTYFGGATDDGITGLAVDGAGNAHVMMNNAPGMPLINHLAGWDNVGQVYVAKFNSAGSQLIYGTYYGGSQLDTGSAITVDSAGSLHITGYTTSTDFPLINPPQRSPMLYSLARVGASPVTFMVKLSTNPTVIYSMYMPGGDAVNAYAPNDSTGDITVDLSGNAFSAGFKIDPGIPADATVPNITSPTFDQAVPVSAVTVSWTAVTGAVLYDLRVFTQDGLVAFSGGIEAATSPAALVSVFNGTYVARIRACTTRNQANGQYTDCGAAVYQRFSVLQLAPAAAPLIVAPNQGQVIQNSTIDLLWNPINITVSRWEVRLTRGGQTELQISVDGGSTGTTYTVSSAGAYGLQVRGCTFSCGPWSNTRTFLVQLPPPPSIPTDVTDTSIANGNELTATWLIVPSADLYQVMVIQPNTGPGGGPLTVAARQISTTTVTLQVPTGPASVIARGCNANGCGPWSVAKGVNIPGPNPAAPIIGSPTAGTQVDGPVVTFAWSRIPGDNGSNTRYRLYVQDLSRQAAALDISTTANFYGAALRAEGNRYDAVVIATQGGQTFQGPASGFIVRGTSAPAPTMTSPQHNSTVQQGNVFLGWTPIADAKIYEYYVAAQGGSNVLLTGVSQGLLIQVPVPAVGGTPTLYNGIVRACTGGTGIADCVWGPWSNNGGGGITAFTAVP